MSNFVSNSANIIIKDGKPNNKFKGIDINNIYKGASTSPPKTSTGKNQHGLQVLGKISSVRRMPPPVNLPSLKSENNLSTENIASTDSVENEGNRNAVTGPTILTGSKDQRWANESAQNVQLSGEAQIYLDTRSKSVEENSHLWSNVSQNYRRKGDGGGYMDDFPTLGTGEMMTMNSHKKSWEEPTYAHGPNLRPQNLLNWKEGGGQNLPPDRADREDLYRGAAMGGYPPRVFPPSPRLPFMSNYHAMMMPPQFPMTGGYIPPMYSGPMRPPNIGQPMRYHGMLPEMVTGQPASHSNLRQVSVVKDTDLETMDKLSDGGWARTNPELNFSEKLVFSDDEDNNGNKMDRSLSSRLSLRNKNDGSDRSSIDKQYSDGSEHSTKDARFHAPPANQYTTADRKQQFYGNQVRPPMDLRFDSDRGQLRPNIGHNIESIRNPIRPFLGTNLESGQRQLGPRMDSYMGQNMGQSMEASRTQIRHNLGINADRYPPPYTADPYANIMDPRYAGIDNADAHQRRINHKSTPEVYNSLDREFKQQNYTDRNAYPTNTHHVESTADNKNENSRLAMERDMYPASNIKDHAYQNDEWINSQRMNVDRMKMQSHNNTQQRAEDADHTRERIGTQRMNNDFDDDTWAQRRQQQQAQDTLVALEKAKMRRMLDENKLNMDDNSPHASKNHTAQPLDSRDPRFKNGIPQVGGPMYSGPPQGPPLDQYWSSSSTRFPLDPRYCHMPPSQRFRNLMTGDLSDKSFDRHGDQHVSDYEAEWRHQEEIQKPRSSTGRLWEGDNRAQKLGKPQGFSESGKSQYLKMEDPDRRGNNKGNYTESEFKRQGKGNLEDFKGYSDNVGYGKKGGNDPKGATSGYPGNSDPSIERGFYDRRGGSNRSTKGQERQFSNDSSKWVDNIDRYPRQDSARSWGDEVENEDRIIAEGISKAGNSRAGIPKEDKREYWSGNKMSSRSNDDAALSKGLGGVKLEDKVATDVFDANVAATGGQSDGANKKPEKSDAKPSRRYHDDKLNVSFSKDKADVTDARNRDVLKSDRAGKSADIPDKNSTVKEDRASDKGKEASKKLDYKGNDSRGPVDRWGKQRWEGAGADGKGGGKSYGKQRSVELKEAANASSQEDRNKPSSDKLKNESKMVVATDSSQNNPAVPPLIAPENVSTKDASGEKKIPSLLDNQVFPTRSLKDLKSIHISSLRYLTSAPPYMGYMTEGPIGYPTSMRLGPREFYRGGGGRSRANRGKGRNRKPAKNLDSSLPSVEAAASGSNSAAEKNNTENKSVGSPKDATGTVSSEKKLTTENNSPPKKSRDRRPKNRRGSRLRRASEVKMNNGPNLNFGTGGKDESTEVLNVEGVVKTAKPDQEKNKRHTPSGISRLPPRMRSTVEPTRIVGTNPYDKRTRLAPSTSSTTNNKDLSDSKRKDENLDPGPHNEEWETASEGSVKEPSQKSGHTPNSARPNNESRKSYAAYRPYHSGAHGSSRSGHKPERVSSPQKNTNLTKAPAEKESKEPKQPVDVGFNNKVSSPAMASGIVMRMDAFSYNDPKLVSDALKEMATRFSWNLTGSISCERKTKKKKVPTATLR